MTSNTSKQLVASFLQFLEGEMNSGSMEDADKEAVEVACQCLQTAFTVTSTDVPATQKPILEIFTDIYPQSVSYLVF